MIWDKLNESSQLVAISDRHPLPEPSGERRVLAAHGREDDGRPPGLLPPRAVSRAVHADPAMWLAGVRALYLQALHPRAVRGVLQNSVFRQDPIGRLARTARFVAVVTYAPAQKAARSAARVRRIHAALQGWDPDTGEHFPVDDPSLLLWIHCAATASYLEVVRRSGLALTDAQADRYIDEQRIAAEMVGLDRRDVPASSASLAGYFADVRPTLRATEEAQEIFQFLTAPPMPPGLERRLALLGGTAGVSGLAYGVASRQSWQRLSRVAYSALPGWAIACYGHPAYPAAATTAALRGMRAVGRLAPADWRARVLRVRE
jgi:uncharacterized protein (DUF2236 family)